MITFVNSVKNGIENAPRGGLKMKLILTILSFLSLTNLVVEAADIQPNEASSNKVTIAIEELQRLQSQLDGTLEILYLSENAEQQVLKTNLSTFTQKLGAIEKQIQVIRARILNDIVSEKDFEPITNVVLTKDDLERIKQEPKRNRSVWFRKNKKLAFASNSKVSVCLHKLKHFPNAFSKNCAIAVSDWTTNDY